MPELIYSPVVYLVGTQQVTRELDYFLEAQGYDWVCDATSPQETLVEVAGRLCYLSFNNPRPGGNRAYIEHIKEVGHGSVLEHAVFSILITGISRSVSHELVRHRAGLSPSQLSQRYVERVRYCVPPLLVEDVTSKTELGKLWYDSIVQADLAYSMLLETIKKKVENYDMPKTDKVKLVRQTARSVLPNAAETQLFLTGNARMWRNFFEQRCSRFADGEIRQLANLVYVQLNNVTAHLFSDYEKTWLYDGTFELTTPNKKV